MGQVIGFVDWPDFLAELRVNPPIDNLVRVQQYTRKEFRPDLGQFWVHYRIVVAAVGENGDVLVARFPVGGGWDFHLDNDEKKVREIEERAKVATQIITEALQSEGFVVRPGIIAGSGDDALNVVTTPTGLWHFENGKLIPETEGSLEAA